MSVTDILQLVKMVSIYVLALIEGKYYVGKSNNVSKRIQDHKSHIGSEWTKRYKPIDVLYIYENCDSFDENKYTIMMMAKYGIDNVRGGSYVKMVISDEERKFIQNEINGAQDRCFKCGSLDHWARNCPKKGENECTRCGRSNHTIEKCYAKTHKNGTELVSIDIPSSTPVQPVVQKPNKPTSSNSSDDCIIL